MPSWTGIWIFVLSGWVGQDYFSPQGFTYLLDLVFVAILLVWFRAPRVLWAKVRPGEAEVEPTDRRQRAVLLMVLIGLFAASVPAHQLTPFVMLGVLAVLVLVGRCELRGLPILFAVLVSVWIGFMAEPYWSGHFNDLFGGRRRRQQRVLDVPSPAVSRAAVRRTNSSSTRACCSPAV